MEPFTRPRILIADDHLLVAEACKRELEPQFAVVAIVTAGAEVFAAATRLRPDVLILDVNMPGFNAFETAEQIKHAHRSIKIVFLTMYSEPALVAEAFRRGVSGFIVKSSGVKDLVLAVQKALRGERHLSPSIDKEIVGYTLRTGAIHSDREITERQKEVLQLLSEGKTMKEVAAALQIKTGTIAFHKYRMMEKLGIKSNAELLKYAVQHHLMPNK